MDKNPMTRFEAKIPKAEGDILWDYIFDREITFTKWLRKQISKMNVTPKRKKN